MWKVIKILYNFFIFSLLIVVLEVSSVEISSYAKVSKFGQSESENATNSSSGNIFRALNTDLWFPQIFNSTPGAKPQEIPKQISTGRAIVESGPYTFPMPVSDRRRLPEQPWREARPQVVYPAYRGPPNQAELDKLQGKGQAMDRYTPGEGVATALFKSKYAGYTYSNPKQTMKPATPTSISTSPNGGYIPPKNLYSFPPNIDSNYLPPPPAMKTKDVITSYLPPPAGPAGLIGPINPAYLPSHLINGDSASSNVDQKSNMPPDDSTKNDMPASSSDSKDTDAMGHDHPPDDQSHNHPPDDQSQEHPPDDSHSYDHFYDHIHGHNHPEIISNTPPPGPPTGAGDTMTMDMPMNMPMDMPMKGPPMSSDHDHDHGPNPHSFPSSFSSPSFYGGHGIDAFPEILYDHDHHHHHFEHDHPPMTTTTTESPPEPRVKKYSYFYLGRKIWYIPLYFTVWFSFYIAFLILKSIARHKVNLPNHYQAKRSIINTMTHKETAEKVDRLTIFVMNQIEDFTNKY